MTDAVSGEVYVASGSGACSLDAATVKGELNMGGSVLQPIELHFMRNNECGPADDDALDFQPAVGDIMEIEKHESQKGVCRCCLAHGRCKPMDHINTVSPTESCANMLEVSFSITFEQPEDGSVEGPNLICDACETRLRDAHTFRRQVIDAQCNFMLQKRTKLFAVKIETLDIRSFTKRRPNSKLPLKMLLSREMDNSEDCCMYTIPQSKPKHLDSRKTVPFKKNKRKTTTASGRCKIGQ